MSFGRPERERETKGQSSALRCRPESKLALAVEIRIRMKSNEAASIELGDTIGRTMAIGDRPNWLTSGHLMR